MFRMSVFVGQEPGRCSWGDFYAARSKPRAFDGGETENGHRWDWRWTQCAAKALTYDGSESDCTWLQHGPSGNNPRAQRDLSRLPKMLPEIRIREVNRATGYLNRSHHSDDRAGGTRVHDEHERTANRVLRRCARTGSACAMGTMNASGQIRIPAQIRTFNPCVVGSSPTALTTS